jgi:hypothetical protein
MANRAKRPYQAVIERQWQWVRNEVQLAAGSATATCKALWLLHKTRILAFPSQAPVVVGSSDSTTAGMDAVDRITDVSKLVWASGGGAHSWCAFQFPATGIHLLWACNTNNAWEATLVASLTGFTGGSTTARPTAADERVLIAADDWTCGDNTRQVLHMWHSADGLQTIIIICQGGDAKTWIVFGKALEPEAGWTTPYFAFAGAQSNSSGGAHATEWQRLYRTPGLKSWGPAGAMDLFASTFADFVVAGGATPACVQANVVDPLTGLYPPQPMALLSVTSGMAGRHGRLPDVWFVAPAMANGLYPTRPDLVKIGNYLFPWEAGVAAPVMT